MNTFAERLKATMLEKGMMQKHLAEKLGVSPATVSAWCTGRNTPDNKHLYTRIADKLGCDAEWLKNGPNIEPLFTPISTGFGFSVGRTKRGDVYMTKETKPDDTKASRPVVIVSNDHINEHASRIEVVFLTSQERKPLPTNVPVMCKVPSTAICSNVCTISKANLTSYVRTCTDEEMKAIDAALLDSLGLKIETEKVVGDNIIERMVAAENKCNELKEFVEWQNETEEQIEKKVYKRLIEELLERVV